MNIDAKEIVNFPGYWATSDGKIWEYKNDGWSECNIFIKNGENHVILNSVDCSVDLIIATTFMDPNKVGTYVVHINGNPLDDSLSNLVGLTASECSAITVT